MTQHAVSNLQFQILYADQEIITAISTVESGLSILQNNRLYRRNEFQVLLLLTTGIERILKVTLYFANYEAGGQFRSLPRLLRATHDLVALRDEVVAKMFTAAYLAKPNMQADLDYIATDPLLKAILQALADFGGGESRYVFMDGIVTPNRPSAADMWPSRQWARLENQIIASLSETINLQALEDQHHYASHRLTIAIERLMRVLGRIFRFGGAGQLGVQHSSYFSHFIVLGEDRFGRTNYVV